MSSDLVSRVLEASRNLRRVAGGEIIVCVSKLATDGATRFESDGVVVFLISPETMRKHFRELGPAETLHGGAFLGVPVVELEHDCELSRRCRATMIAALGGKP